MECYCFQMKTIFNNMVSINVSVMPIWVYILKLGIRRHKFHDTIQYKFSFYNLIWQFELQE